VGTRALHYCVPAASQAQACCRTGDLMFERIMLTIVLTILALMVIGLIASFVI
jgi:hypothetical protein